MALSDILNDREKMIRLFQIAFWASLVLLAVGYAIIIRDLLG